MYFIKIYIITIGKLSFHIAHVSILGSIECGNTRNEYFQVNGGEGEWFEVKEILCQTFIKTTGIEIQSNHWVGIRYLSMEVNAVDYFPNMVDLGSKETKSELYAYISDDNEQYACDSHAHIVYLFKN